jgi:hypothetical protein
MKKTFLMATAISLSILTAQAQSDRGFTFGGGLDIGLPTGSFSNGWNFGFGFQLQGEQRFNDALSGVISTGYTSYFGKSLNDGSGYSFKVPNVGFIPILVGLRIYPSEQFFIGGQIGLGAFTNTGASGNTGFDFNPQIGYNGNSCQLILGYNVVTVTAGSNSDVGLTLIFKFGQGGYHHRGY